MFCFSTEELSQRNYASLSSLLSACNDHFTSEFNKHLGLSNNSSNNRKMAEAARKVRLSLKQETNMKKTKRRKQRKKLLPWNADYLNRQPEESAAAPNPDVLRRLEGELGFSSNSADLALIEGRLGRRLEPGSALRSIAVGLEQQQPLVTTTNDGGSGSGSSQQQQQQQSMEGEEEEKLGEEM